MKKAKLNAKIEILKKIIAERNKDIQTLILKPDSSEAKLVKILSEFRMNRDRAVMYGDGGLFSRLNRLITTPPEQHDTDKAVENFDPKNRFFKDKFYPKDVKNIDLDTRQTPEQVAVSEWIDRVGHGHTPDWFLGQLFQGGEITPELYLSLMKKTSLEMIDFLNSLQSVSENCLDSEAK